MMNAWWWLWVVMVAVALVPALGYGSVYRGWGAPYPRFVQRRRFARAYPSSGSAMFDHQSWGRGGDYVWMVGLIGVLGAIPAILWR